MLFRLCATAFSDNAGCFLYSAQGLVLLISTRARNIYTSGAPHTPKRHNSLVVLSQYPTYGAEEGRRVTPGPQNPAPGFLSAGKVRQNREEGPSRRPPVASLGSGSKSECICLSRPTPPLQGRVREPIRVRARLNAAAPALL